MQQGTVTNFNIFVQIENKINTCINEEARTKRGSFIFNLLVSESITARQKTIDASVKTF
jgi:hypothetical protein